MTHGPETDIGAAIAELSARNPGRVFSPKDIEVVRRARAISGRRRRAANGGTLSREWKKKNPEKRHAHRKVAKALKSGRLSRKPCSRCGSEINVHAHHEDYSRWLDVIWLCGVCHMQRHRELSSMSEAAE